MQRGLTGGGCRGTSSEGRRGSGRACAYRVAGMATLHGLHRGRGVRSKECPSKCKLAQKQPSMACIGEEASDAKRV